jgi:pfkB family carbohydrate kinase
MILVVSLNPALDVTHHVAGVDWSGVNRPQRVSTAPGGKGLNVARTLRALGADVRVVGLAGGVTGEAVAAGQLRPDRRADPAHVRRGGHRQPRHRPVQRARARREGR